MKLREAVRNLVLAKSAGILVREPSDETKRAILEAQKKVAWESYERSATGPREMTDQEWETRAQLLRRQAAEIQAAQGRLEEIWKKHSGDAK